MTEKNPIVNTVLGAIPADGLGVVAPLESPLSVLPGAQYGYDITIDRAAVFATLRAKLTEFRAAGGGTLVDATGQFHGRDPKLLEALSRSTEVHLVASTGQGPGALLGGYFLTPQTNPPTPWPAEKWADLFAQEISEGMVVPRVERRGPAGLIVTAVTTTGATPTDVELLKGTARVARETGTSVSFTVGNDPLAELEVVLAEGLDPSRVAVRGLDRVDAGSAVEAIAGKGAYVALDHAGTQGSHQGSDYVTDADRIALIRKLIDAGHGERLLLSSSATGAAFGHSPTEVSFAHVLTVLVPALRKAGVDEGGIQRILMDNPAALLTLR